MLRRIQHIAAISKIVIRRYRHRTRAHFHRINNPVAPLFFTSAPDPTPGRLLLVGNMTPIKGIDVAIETIQRLLPNYPHLQLTIVGRNSDQAYGDRIRTLAGPLGSAIHFLDPVDQLEIKRLLGKSQALLLTSNHEHAPMIVSEAMAAGRPVVATQVGALADMITTGVTGYLAPVGDAKALASSLARLLDDPAHASQLGANAARVAREQYHPTTVADGYLRALRTAMAQA